MDMAAPVKLGPKHKNMDTTGKGWKADQLSESETKVSWSTIILKIAIVIRFCMADKLLARSPYKTLQN